MIKAFECPTCKAQCIIHSKATFTRCPDCREKLLIRESETPVFEEATKIVFPEPKEVKI